MSKYTIISPLKHTTTNDLALTEKRVTTTPELIISDKSSKFSAGSYDEFYLSKNNLNITSKNLSKSIIDAMESYDQYKNNIRNINVSYPTRGQSLPVFNVNNEYKTYFEYLFQHFYIGETGSKYKISNAEYEFRAKYDLLTKYNTLYPLDGKQVYSYSVFRSGRGSELTLINSTNSYFNKVKGYILTKDGKAYNTPFIKAEGFSQNVSAFVVVRGIPIKMKRVETSHDDKYNYIFSYPEYILNDISRLESIQMILFSEKSSDSKVFDGKVYNNLGYRPLLTDTYDSYLRNLNIVVPHNGNHIISL